MKNSNIILALFTIALFSACKKDYICTCTTNNVRDVKHIVNSSRRAAEANCMTFKQTSTIAGKDTTISTVCVLSN
jgi:hypothetical protein